MPRLSRGDYLMILDHYGEHIPKGRTRSNTRRLKSTVERLIARKLCNCIKAVKKKGQRFQNERVAIPICIRSVLQARGLRLVGRFTCKRKQRTVTRSSKNKLIKTS